MKVATTIVRILLGLLFVAAGALSFIFTNPPPLPGLAGQFNDAFAHAHWSMFVGAAQIAAGVLLVINRYVTVALIIIAAFLYNSLAFHIAMMPSGLPMALVVLALWFFLSWKYRRAFIALFTVVQ